jgi:cytochrome c5
MSDSHDSSDAHEGPIKTPKQLALAVFASFMVPILVIVLLANYISFGTKPAAGSDGLGEEAVARRLQPVGSLEIRDASAPRVLRTGEQVFQAVCSACHSSGAAGAPKVGDNDAWAPRIKTGYDALLTSVVKGKGAMAALGGGEYSEVELGRAVVYLTGKAGASFPEPKVPEAAASAAAPAASAAK